MLLNKVVDSSSLIAICLCTSLSVVRVLLGSLVQHSLNLSLELFEMVCCFTSPHVEVSEIIEIGLDIINGKINEHTSDLRSSLFTDQLLDILIDKLTDDSPVVRFFANDARNVTESFYVIVINYRFWVVEGSIKLLTTNDHCWLGERNISQLDRKHLLRNNWARPYSSTSSTSYFTASSSYSASATSEITS